MLGVPDSADTPMRFGTVIACAKNVLEMLYYESTAGEQQLAQSQTQPQQVCAYIAMSVCVYVYVCMYVCVHVCTA